MTDIAVQLLILEGVPFLAFIYYLTHKRRMYLLEKGIKETDDFKVRSERRIISGIFLVFTGIFMILAPKLADASGIETRLTFELVVASLIVLCAGIAMLIGAGLLKYKTNSNSKVNDLAELK